MEWIIIINGDWIKKIERIKFVISELDAALLIGREFGQIRKRGLIFRKSEIISEFSLWKRIEIEGEFSKILECFSIILMRD